MKICSKCGGTVEAMYEKYGRICRACRSRAATERNRKDPTRARAAGARHRARNPGRSRPGNWRKQGIRMTVAEYERILESQGGRCAICGSSRPGGHGRYFHVDHDHRLGHVRGLLCSPCNRALGAFKDSSARLRAAIRYLERNQAQVLSR